MAQDDGNVDADDAGLTGKQSHHVHGVQRQPTDRKHRQHNTEPLGRSDFNLYFYLFKYTANEKVITSILFNADVDPQ